MSEFQPVELPANFKWQELKALRAWIPIPDKWFFLSTSIQDTRGYALSKEDTRRSFPFMTGLSINAIFHLNQKLGITPAQIVTRDPGTPPGFRALNETLVKKEGPFYIRRGEFTGMNPLGTRIPISMFLEVIMNERTGTGYTLAYQSPSVEWDHAREIGKIMIEQKYLDPTV